MVATSGLDVGALRTVTVSQSTAGAKSLSPQRPPHTPGFCAQVDKCLSASMRRKLLQELEAKPRVFEALPSAGTLAPGQRCNMRVRFSPVEEVRLAGVTPRRSGRAVWKREPSAGDEVWPPHGAFCQPRTHCAPVSPVARASEKRFGIPTGSCTGSIQARRCGSLSAHGGDPPVSPHLPPGVGMSAGCNAPAQSSWPARRGQPWEGQPGLILLPVPADKTAARHLPGRGGTVTCSGTLPAVPVALAQPACVFPRGLGVS